MRSPLKKKRKKFLSHRDLNHGPLEPKPVCYADPFILNCFYTISPSNVLKFLIVSKIQITGIHQERMLRVLKLKNKIKLVSFFKILSCTDSTEFDWKFEFECLRRKLKFPRRPGIVSVIYRVCML